MGVTGGGAVLLAAVGGSVLAVLSVWVAVLYTAAVSFRSRWHSRFVDPPQPDWVRVFPRYVWRKIDWGTTARLTLLAAAFGGLLGGMGMLAAIGLGVVL